MLTLTVEIQTEWLTPVLINIQINRKGPNLSKSNTLKPQGCQELLWRLIGDLKSFDPNTYQTSHTHK